MRRTRLRPVSARRAEGRWEWEQLKRAVHTRDGWQCRAVGLWPHECVGPLDAHHVKARGVGGEDTLENLVSLCRKSHTWVTEHPVEAAAVGLRRWSWQ